METLFRHPNGKNPWPTVSTANILTLTLPTRQFLFVTSQIWVAAILTFSKGVNV